jgi:hypothetical protein
MNLTKNVLGIITLSEDHALGIGSHFNTEKVVQIAKVFNWKELRELLKQDLMSLGRRTDNHYIVHIYQHVDCKSGRVINKQRCED